MPRPKGSLKSQVAAFIFKDDKKNQLAWEDAGGIPHGRIELHTRRADFLPALAAWQAEVPDPDNAHLLIYGHGHARGIATTEKGAELVTWDEIGTALGRAVAVLWVVGCETRYALNAWPSRRLAQPVPAFWSPRPRSIGDRSSNTSRRKSTSTGSSASTR